MRKVNHHRYPLERHEDAVNLLREMLERRGLNSYEKAQIWNTLAFAYFTLNDIPNTIHAYEQILAQVRFQSHWKQDQFENTVSTLLWRGTIRQIY